MIAVSEVVSADFRGRPIGVVISLALGLLVFWRMASLIQQRFAINRMGVRALWILWISVAMLVLAGLMALTGERRSPTGASILLLVAGLVYGLTELRRHRQILREFEAENGPGAGTQTSRSDL